MLGLICRTAGKALCQSTSNSKPARAKRTQLNQNANSVHLHQYKSILHMRSYTSSSPEQPEKFLEEKIETIEDDEQEIAPPSSHNDILTQYSHKIATDPHYVISEVSKMIQSDSVEAFLVRAAAYSRISEYALASEDLARAVEKASPELVQSRKLYYHLAEAFRMSDQPEKALGAVERGLVVATSDADRAVYYVSRGASHMEMGNFKEALAWYNKAITYYDSVEDRQMLGEVLENAGLCSGALDDYDNAFGSLMKAHMLGQKLSGRSFTLLAFHAIYHTNFEAALQWFQLALAESADGEPEVHAQLALLYSMKQDTHSTIEHVNKVFLLGAQEEQLSSAFLRSAVWAFCREGKLDTARALVADMKARYPDDGDTYIAAGFVFSSSYLQRNYSSVILSINAGVAAGRLKQAEGDVAGSLHEFEQGIHKAPDLEVYTKYIMALVNNTQYEDAAIMLEQSQTKESLYARFAAERLTENSPPKELLATKRWMTIFLHPNTRVYPHYSEEFVWALAHLSDGNLKAADDAVQEAYKLLPVKKEVLKKHYEEMKKILLKGKKNNQKPK